MKVFCGIDWSERHHDVALVDQDGTLIAKRRIGESVEDFTELLTLLAEAGDNAEEPIPVAIETSRGLLVAALRATGRPIYAITPMAVARYRERHCVSRKKSDHVDAMILLAKAHAGIEATEAAMTSVDRLGFSLRLKTTDGAKGARINFLHEVTTAQDTRAALVEMVRQARARG